MADKATDHKCIVARSYVVLFYQFLGNEAVQANALEAMRVRIDGEHTDRKVVPVLVVHPIVVRQREYVFVALFGV
jgi:hypothetical protein